MYEQKSKAYENSCFCPERALPYVILSINKNSEPRDLYVETVVVHGVMSQVVDSPELSVETWDEYRGCLQLRRWQTSSLGSAGKLAEQFW